MTPQKMDLANVHELSEKEMLVVLMTTMNSICDSCEAMSNKISIQNGRIGKLEGWRNYIMGGLAVISAGISIFAGFVFSKL